jgi:UDP-perosamine 4-acetyltransferase
MQGVILLGAGGHAKVVLDLILSLGHSCVAVVFPEKVDFAYWRGIPAITELQLVENYSPDQVELVLGMGFMPGNRTRRDLFFHYKAQGYKFCTLCHPTACVASSVSLGEGCQIMAGAIIQADASCADNVIINTAARIEHDTHIGAHSHIAPGVVLCGGVIVESEVFVGASSTIIQNKCIGKGSVVAAGAVVVEDVASYQLAVGCPAQIKALSN